MNQLVNRGNTFRRWKQDVVSGMQDLLASLV
jgi:hypothetical protein